MSDAPEVGPELVAHVARLARLQLTDEEIAALVPQLSRILSHVEQVRTLELGAAPAPVAAADWNDLRPDEPGATLRVQDMLRNAPAHDGAFLVVPRVLDEEVQ